MNNNFDETEIYEGLASVYDELMRDIDYNFWADYINDLIQTYHPDARTVLELACGTGSFALSLEEYNEYEITATDLSEAMIRVAASKDKDHAISWKVMDVRKMELDRSFDLVLMLFDSINYLMKDEEVITLFRDVGKLLKPKGLFIFDFTTPVNSIGAEKFLNEDYTTSTGWHYIRRSHFHPKEGLHYNDFEIIPPKDSGIRKPIHESHCQRVFTLRQMISLIARAGRPLLASYEGFDFIEATENSDRITMILR